MKEVNQVFESVKEQLDLASNLLQGGFCVMAAKLAYEGLISLGIKDLRIAGGRAFYSVNKGKDGLMDYGYTGNSLVGEFVGHFWLVYKEEWIIDFTLYYLKDAFIKDNKRRGIQDRRFKLDKQIMIPIWKNSTLRALYDGKIGFHYSEIKDRGEMIWLDTIPDIKPVL